jgi:phosphoserine aminotransferase
MLCVEDALDGLGWAEGAGGLAGLIARSESNLAVVRDWVERTPWVDFLARDPATRSCTSICLQVADPDFAAQAPDAQKKVLGALVALLEKEAVAYDIASYRDAPQGLRIWGGATIERSDLEALLPWLDWAWSEVTR